jgi:DMSO/TMAO reductase YedYZ molybdopterin-dependent catalytic subunit
MTASQPTPEPQGAATTAGRLPTPLPRPLAALAGVVAALVGLAVGELLAAVLDGVPSPLVAVGAAIIDLAPPGSKEVVVALFGTNDKPALAIAILVVVGVLAAGIGIVGRTRPVPAAAGIVAIVGVGVLASLRLPDSAPVAVVLSGLLQAGAAVLVLSWLLRSGAGSPADDSTDGRATRRAFLLRAGAFGALAVAGLGVGRRLLEERAVRAGQVAAGEIPIPQPVDPAPTIGPDGDLTIDGLTPLVTPNDDFYRIDTALITPAVDVATWRLRVHGMVEREVSLSFDELVQLPLIERYVTIACVSNEVGGDLIGNAKWTGVRLTDVLDMAGVLPGATQIVPRSVDGWTAGFPTTWATDPEQPRDALIAVRMNDVPLPVEHGFPARLIVPGLYGYVSATKWLADIELTTMEAFDAYWVPRGWAKEAPVLTQSRIDVPRSSAKVPAGPVTVAGVAWAMDRGVERVEVSVDKGAWQPASLGEVIGPQTWVQWTFTWQATPGLHEVAVRATDGTGEVQTDEFSPQVPDGARGHHHILVTVT